MWKKEGDVIDEEKQELLDAMRTQTMTSEDWDKLLGGAKKLSVSKGTPIITAGEPFQSLYQIEKGACDIVVPIGEGKTITVTQLVQGNFLNFKFN